ncbi:MAG: hypothetical protein HYW02_05160 [Deltaproteobacteria bacterium]|nr:hypothetical protein [Deltaproteobacteria bacterium]
MFKILFHRSGLLVRILEIVGLLNTYRFFREPSTTHLTTLYAFLLVNYLFIRLCDLVPWYTKSGHSFWDKKIGIRVHFQKALVPTSYILAIVSSLCLLQIEPLSTILLLLAGACFIIMTPVNFILIWFHFNDKEKTPVNYFSLNKQWASSSL